MWNRDCVVQQSGALRVVCESIRMPMSHTESGTKVPTTPERRSTPRLQLVSPLVGQDESGHDVTLMNISDGGLLVYTTQPALAGEVRQFRFQLAGEAAPTQFSARVVHVLRVSDAGAATYAIGLEFVSGLSDDARRALERLATLATP